ncbi:MAG: lysophospholipase [Candidatus Eisenbacteria sp.]|nr:lysophospholipase [Candidatus Eisenbacteria bacterium]
MTNAAVVVHHREGRIRSSDGLLLFEQSWAPATPRAVVGLVHGYAEHSSRYDATARCLARDGYAVQTLDLRGHGRSEGKRCFVSDFREYLSDVDAVLQRAARSWPERPVFLMGHSLGGLIALLFVIERSVPLSGLILSAPSVRLGSDFSPFKARVSELLGRTFPGFPTVKFRSESLSSDENVVQAYRDDELVYRGRTPARTASEIIRTIRAVQERMHRIELPLLVMHGADDQVADVEGSRQLYEGARSADKSLRIYDGFYHEIMNEPEKAIVLGEISAWLNARDLAHRSGRRPNQ